MVQSLRSLLVLLLVMAPAGPVSAGGPPSADASTGRLVGPAWELSEIPGGVAVLPGVQIVFDAAGTAAGNGGCNRFRGRYTRKGSALTLGPLAMTRMACLDPARSALEQAVVAGLNAMRAHRIEGTRLEMRDAVGLPVLVWRRR